MRVASLDKISIFVLAVAFVSLTLIAQETQNKTTQGNNVTVTGCLQKGDEAGEYTITGNDGTRATAFVAGA